MSENNVNVEPQFPEEDVSSHVKLIQFIRKNVYDIAIVVVCLSRILFGLAEIQKTGKTVVGIIADGAVTLVFSIILSHLLQGKGLLAGEGSKTYQSTLKSYNVAKTEAGKWICNLDDWCSNYTETRYKERVTAMLLPLGLSYDQYISHQYEEDKFNDVQKKQYAKLKKLKLHRITTNSLMSGEIESDREIDYEKTTKQNFVRRSTGGDFLAKVILSIVFGYFTLPPIAQWNWAGALWAFLHTSLIFGLSIVKYISAYNFVNDELRAKLIDKTNKLNLFIKEQKANEQQSE